MRRRRGKSFAVWIFLGLMMAWSLYQIFDLFQANSERRDPQQLLYQVSLFQMELLNSYLSEVGSLSNTNQLDAVKQAAYSASYTHERMRLALGESRVSGLDSLHQFMQYILRLQIGGQRPLKPDELQLLHTSAKLFKDMYDAYSQLLHSNQHVVLSAQNTKLAKSDAELTAILRKRLLQ